MESNVEVLIRVCPLQVSQISQETKEGKEIKEIRESKENDEPFLIVDETDGSISLSREKKGKNSFLDFKFSEVLGPESTQSALYSCCNLIDDVIDGVNCCIIAYGQTSTGKSYSMVGNGWDEDLNTTSSSINSSSARSLSLPTNPPLNSSLKPLDPSPSFSSSISPKKRSADSITNTSNNPIDGPNKVINQSSPTESEQSTHGKKQSITTEVSSTSNLLSLPLTDKSEGFFLSLSLSLSLFLSVVSS
jgi:hypothetical protein